MATTWFRPLHINKGKTIAKTLADRTDYAEDPEKTNGGELVTGYMCNPLTADEEFYLSKRKYEFITGRNNGSLNVLAYQIRLSFKPGEITPQEANEIGHELAMRFFKGKHAFIVATHIDKRHVHNYILINSTTLDCTHKFDNFRQSGRVMRRLSDIICAEHGLSVIENPKPSKGRAFGKWLGENKPVTWNDKLKAAIDMIVPKCATFEDFIAALIAAGYSVDQSRKHISVRAAEQKVNRRLDTLGGDYTEAAIRARLGIVRIITSSGDSGTQTRVSLLVDIQEKLRNGKGPGYEQWAKIFNLKEAAKTLVFLQENGIDSYDDLKLKASASSGSFGSLSKEIKDIEKRQKEISELQRNIVTYAQTRAIYDEYKQSNWSRAFYDEHITDISMHRAAKKFFSDQGFKGKLPPMASLKKEWAELNTQKKKLYSDYHKQKDNARAIVVAKHNADVILGMKPEDINPELLRSTYRRNVPER